MQAATLKAKFKNYPLYTDHFPWKVSLPFFSVTDIGDLSDLLPYWNKLDKLRKAMNSKDDTNRGITVWFVTPWNPVVPISSYEKAQYIFKATDKVVDKSASVIEIAENWITGGLLLTSITNGTWKPRRKMLTPAFHFSALQSYYHVMKRHADKFIQLLKENDDSVGTDIFNRIALSALDIISETSMGVSTHAQTSDKSQDYVKALSYACHKLMERMVSPTKMKNILFKIFHPFESKEFDANRKILADYIERVILDRIKNPPEKTENVFIDVLIHRMIL